MKKLDGFLLKYSKIVDNTDMYLGPISSLVKDSDDELLQVVGIASKIVDVSLKIPYTLIYLTKTKDFQAISYFAKREVLSATIPYGGFIEIGRHYEKRLNKNMYEKKK